MAFVFNGIKVDSNFVDIGPTIHKPLNIVMVKTYISVPLELKYDSRKETTYLC
jgi:hypothetical protein